MHPHTRLRTALSEVIRDVEPGLPMADRLCHACVQLLGVDGAALSFVQWGQPQGTIASSGPASAEVDALQLLYGEGPCLDAVSAGAPVLAQDLATDTRWPMFRPEALRAGTGAVFALPVALSASYVGALDLFRQERGPMTEVDLAGGLLATELASLVVLDLLAPDLTGTEQTEDGWDRLGQLSTIEVSQATGMVMGQLNVTSEQALIRLRAHAFAVSRSVSEVAWDIIERRLVLDSDLPQTGAS